MKCTVLEKDFQPLWPKLLPPGVIYVSKAMYDDEWSVQFLRMKADNDTLTLKCRYSTITIPAQVERRGVAFWPLEEFAKSTNHLIEFHGATDFTIDATESYFSVVGHAEPAEKFPVAVFNDPATAPQEWIPPLDYFSQFENPYRDSLSSDPRFGAMRVSPWPIEQLAIQDRLLRNRPTRVPPPEPPREEPTKQNRPRKKSVSQQLSLFD